MMRWLRFAGYGLYLCVSTAFYFLLVVSLLLTYVLIKWAGFPKSLASSTALPGDFNPGRES